MTSPIVRPADAAGLVLLRGSGPATEVLMGRRSSCTRFMPGAFVFPGGRVDRADSRPSGFPEPLRPAPAGLDLATRRRGLTFARTALRETFEETGLLVGCADASKSGGASNSMLRPLWDAYQAAGLAPAFDGLNLVARAITPTDSPIRYHARFFLADGQLTAGRLGGSGELVDLDWIRIKDLPDYPVADITELVLEEALARWRAGVQDGPVTLFSWSRQAEAPVRRTARPS